MPATNREFFEQNHDPESPYDDRTQPLSLNFEHSTVAARCGNINSASKAEISQLVLISDS